MVFSAEQIRKVAELRDNLSAEVEKHREAVELLEKNISILDMILKESSFAKASSLVAASDLPADKAAPDVSSSTESPIAEEPIPIKDKSDKQIIARAHVTPKQVSIILDGRVQLSSSMPPFKSFFLDRIIDGMRKKDFADADAGRIPRESVIDCTVNEDNSRLGEIIVRNYREKGRITEIINTVRWSLTRMLESNG